MANATFYPGISGDDGYVSSTGSEYNNNASYLIIGGYGGTYYHLWVRFPNVTIPAGAIITTAYVTFTANENQSGTPVNLNLYFNNVDDAVAPTNASEFSALVLTSAIAWDGLSSWSNGSTYNTSEIKTILQEVIDRPGWVSGQAITLAVKDDGSSSSAGRVPSSIEQSAGAEKAQLYVEWELPPSFEVEGYVTEKGIPVVRQLYLYDSSDGSLVNSTTSSGDGYYNMTATTSGSHFIVCLDDDAGEQYNDLILGRVFPDAVI